jgi:hypothetical protein
MNTQKRTFTVVVEIADFDLTEKRMKVQATSEAEAYEIAYNLLESRSTDIWYDYAIVNIF